MESQTNRPIFVVGSPRSGTSILTWCLGHHPNLFPVPESNWMGAFALSTAVACRIGASRGDYSMLSAMDIPADELFAGFGDSINEVILHHRKNLETKRETRSAVLKIEAPWLEATSTLAGPKARWVDGTPEYSLHICGLRKLFPHALFIHLFRDVREVVRSMVHFHRATGIQLVAGEEEAYRYWIRTVRACLLAERAYGANVVRRISYADLMEKPEPTMRCLLDFVGEVYTAKCLEPLAHRINSSDVPSDFVTENPAADSHVIEEATNLYNELQNTPRSVEPSSAAVEEMDAVFAQRTQYMTCLDSNYQKALQALEKLRQGKTVKSPGAQTASNNPPTSISKS